MKKISKFPNSSSFPGFVWVAEKYHLVMVQIMSHNNGLCDTNRQDQGNPGGQKGAYPCKSMSHNTRGGGGVPKNGAQKQFFQIPASPAPKFASNFN